MHVIFALLLLLNLTAPLAAWANESSETDADSSDADSNRGDREAYWEFGAGVGAVHYEHYPASNEFSDMALPFPTFQYRGKILRADDREGARAYLLKNATWTLELAGAGFPALDSSNNRARRGMQDLPWLIALGPQFVAQISPEWQLSFGAFQAISTDFEMTRTAGHIYEARAAYRWDFPISYFERLEAGESFGRLFLTVKAGSQDLNALYFDVPTNKVTPDRPAYVSKAGLISQELAYYQSFKSGRATVYVGGALSDYTPSANRQSPLHLSNLNTTYVIGLTWVLGESARRGVPDEETSGLMNQRFPRRDQPEAL